MLLCANGHQVHCASNGKEALGLLTELSTMPDLILLDAHMPTMDGFQFRQLQKLNPRFRDIPVIVMTGEDDERMGDRMMKPHGILVKPLSVKSIVDSISLYL